MILKNISVGERKKLTNGYPVLLGSSSGSGKSTAVANLSLEEKARTVILNFDNKAISDDDSEFLAVRHPHDKTDKSAYLLDDDEVVEKITNQILKAASSDKVDRIIIDTSTELLKFLELWSNEHFSGFDAWKEYNNAITAIFNACKEAVITYGKFVYVFGHYPPAEKGTVTKKRFLTTKGNEHKNVLEEKFTTVVEAILEDRQFKFYADSFEEFDTTKTKLKQGFFKFPRESLDDLEQVLTGTKALTQEESGGM